MFQHLLYHIVAKLVFHHLYDGSLGTAFSALENLCMELNPLCLRAVLEHLLHHIARELMHTHSQDVAFDSSPHLVFVLHSPSLQDVLNDVVTELIFAQLKHGTEHLFQDGCGLLWRAILQNALQHTTPILIGGQLRCLAIEGLHDEVDHSSVQLLNGLLHHMIAILVFDALQHHARWVKFGHQFGLLVFLHLFDSLLHHTAAIHLVGEFHHPRSETAGHDLGLLIGAVLNKFLDHVVPEYIGHEFQSIRKHF